MAKIGLFLFDEARIGNVGLASHVRLTESEDSNLVKERAIRLVESALPELVDFPSLAEYLAGTMMGTQAGRESDRYNTAYLEVISSTSVGQEVQDLIVEGFLNPSPWHLPLPALLREQGSPARDQLHEASKAYVSSSAQERAMPGIPPALRQLADVIYERFWEAVVAGLPANVYPFGVHEPDMAQAHPDSTLHRPFVAAAQLILEAAPGLTALHVGDLLTVREELAEPIAHFRAAVHRAVRELPEQEPHDLSSYWIEVVEPELLVLDRELRTSSTLLRAVRGIDFADIATAASGVGFALGTAAQLSRALALGLPVAFKTFRAAADEWSWREELQATKPFYLLYALRRRVGVR